MSDWSADHVDLLKKHYAEGYSFAQIAFLLGGGFSRNAVIGKAHRINLPRRGPHSQNPPAVPGYRGPGQPRKPRQQRTVARSTGHGGGVGRNIKARVGKAFATVATTLPPEAPTAPNCDPVTLLSRTDKQCAWPIGEPCGPDTLMCGSTDKADELESLCRYHRKIAGGAKTRPEWTPERRAAFYRGRARNASAEAAP